MILLIGGEKSTQQRDIEKAKKIWNNNESFKGDWWTNYYKTNIKLRKNDTTTLGYT